MLQEATVTASQVSAAPTWVQAADALAWPVLVLVLVIVFRKPARSLLGVLERRLDAGASFKFYAVEVGQAPTNLPMPSRDEPITDNHLALLHSSWRYPKKDAEFGRRMWAFHVVVQARDEVLDRVEYVKYILDPSYPNPVQVVTDRRSRFKLKELANGESTVRAEIGIRGQDKPARLSRYINLTATGPRI